MKSHISELTDLTGIAKVHRSAFPKSLSTSMGLKYCTKMLSWFIETESAFMLHIEENGTIIGYCGGIVSDGTLPTGAASGMLQHSMNAAIKAFVLNPTLLFHPELRKKYKLTLRNIFSKLGLKKNKISDNVRQERKKEPVTGLVVIGVHSDHRQKGLGQLLLKMFEDHSSSIGINHLRLTVLTDNTIAIKAYKKSGWTTDSVAGTSTTMSKVL